MARLLAALAASFLSLAPVHGADRVLAVFAHPDDEILVSGALVMAARRGADVHLVYCTSGDAGQDRSGRSLSGKALASVRESETTTALARLGLKNAPVFLRYPDGQLPAHAKRLQPELEELMKRVRPTVVVTFGPDGVTGHPDHIATGTVALAAFDRTGVGRELWTFVVSGPRVKPLEPHVKQFEVVPVAASRVNATIDAKAAVDARVAGMRAHTTQFPAPLMDLLEKWFRESPIDELIRTRGDGAVPCSWTRARRRKS